MKMTPHLCKRKVLFEPFPSAWVRLLPSFAFSVAVGLVRHQLVLADSCKRCSLGSCSVIPHAGTVPEVPKLAALVPEATNPSDEVALYKMWHCRSIAANGTRCPQSHPRTGCFAVSCGLQVQNHFWIVQGRPPLPPAPSMVFSSQTPSPDHGEAEGSHRTELPALHVLPTSPTLHDIAPALAPCTLTTTCNRY